ncbi:DNA polymerase III subunit gamma/tau [Nitratiruptor sp. YY08-26]|uniref:DNA polymerase III subunit gamma/tau n=1 Tax=unclassified Nitratiruptor TaxID=2624044 RepID=UPI0019152EFC|nr:MULTISPECIES: DNA polymerase III subunit gamma/tau [unclassified Nitratiruptor]BCD62738.1 DNA polymerase III subunit gamma/tau [Nitratiruptor sp. YY08-13]BCD66674.1 DNA polymerase III subunit gamma/tau [Nitratiruptor sp. YY08-26]
MTLALKYRPKRFEDLIGQEAISQTLQRALDTNQLSHAYLFSGLRGSGKTSTARIFSKCLLCDEGPTSTPCEKCENCTAANENRHIDIIEMDAASNRKIDDIRDLIEHTKYKPAQGRFKIFIIDEVHMLTKEAFNALLKTLEEPPEYVKFILATTDPLKLPATILSRTQHFRFKKIAQKDILHHLEYILNIENVAFEPEALQIIARSGSGSLRDTLTLLDQAIIYAKGKITVQNVTSMLGLVDPKEIEEIYSLILNQEREKVLEKIASIRDYQSEMVLDEMIIYLKEELFKKSPKFSLMLYERFFKILSESKNLLFYSSDDEFVLTLTMLKLLEATKIKTIEEVIHEIEQSDSIPTATQESQRSQTVQKTLIEPIAKNSKDPFQKLIDKLYDRNYELGECFEKSVKFVSFENGVLKWQSNPQGACKEKLKLSYPTIRHFVQEIFGVETKIQKVEPPKEDESSCSSMVEEAEFGSSCIQKEAGLAAKEIEAQDILNDPLVQKAKELFKAKRVVVKPKV